MSSIFSQWQNKEISDLDCIRQLKQQNKELINLFKDIHNSCRHGCIVNQEWIYLKIDELLQKYGADK